MAFDITANINARLNSANVRTIANQLRSQLSVTATVNIRLANNTSQGVRTLTGSLASLNTQLAAIVTNSTNANNALSGLAAAFQNINAQLSQTAQSQQALGNIANQAKNAGTQMEQFGKQAGLAFRRFAGFRIASGFISEFLGATSSAVSEAIKFQTQVIKISQVTGRSIGSLSTLSDEVTRLSTSLGVSSQELISISRILAQAGLSANQTQQALEALAKSSLAPTFTDINQTAEGAIAIFAQFGIQANQLSAALGSINAVSGQFAVESDDIIAAVKRAGGVFAATSSGVSEGVDALNEFIAVFTSVRATTRESAESIATGLRTIFTRIQRPTTIAFLQELGVQLQDVEGKFVGPFEAINRISSALQTLDSRDPQFAKLVEELGGFRQVGKVIPLLTEQETRLKALAVAKEGQNSLDKDSEIAQQALAIQLQKVREEFAALIRELTATDTFQALVKTTLELTSGLIKLASALKPVLPLIGAFAAFRGATALTQFSSGLFSRGGLRFHSGGFVGRQQFTNGGDIRPTGIVPGGRGMRDDVPATLQTGEFVIRRRAVDAIGRQNLEKLNKTGRAEFAEGGIVNQTSIGAALLAPLNFKSDGSFVVKQSQVPSLPTKTKSFTFKREALDQQDRELVTNQIRKGAINGIVQGAKALAGTNFSSGSASRILDSTNPQGILGSLFEGVLQGVNTDGRFDSSPDPNRPFDFINGFNTTLGKKFSQLSTIKYIDAKVSDKAANKAGLLKKTINQLNFEASVSNRNQPRKLTPKQQELEDAKLADLNRRRTKLGLPPVTSRIRRASGGEVPAMLTRGEFVVNRRAASSVGLPMLNQLNNADRSNFASGGSVGKVKKRRGFINGGAVLNKAIDDLISILNPSTRSRGPGRRQRRTQIVRQAIGRNIRQQSPVIGAAGFAAGSVIGGPVGAGISGASIGAGIGSALPGVGTAVGAVVGGITSALSSLADANLEKKIQASSKIIEESLSNVEKALSDFAKSNDVNALISSFQGVSAGSQLIASQELSQRAGFVANVTGAFRERGEGADQFAGDNARRASIAGATLSEAVIDGITSGITPTLFAGALAGVATGGLGATTAGLTSGVLGTVINSPEDFVSAATVTAGERRRANTDLAIGQNIRASFAPVAEGAEQAFRELLSRGQTVSQASRQLGAEGQVALASRLGNNRQLEAIGGANNEEARTTISRNIIREAGEAIRQQVLLQQKLAQATQVANANLDTFVNDLEDLSSVILRAGDSGQEFSRRNEALLGSGITSSARVNPFENPRAFSNEELARAATNVVQGLGGDTDSEGFAGELFKGLSSFNDLTTRLPQVLANVALNQTDSSASQLVDIEKAITTNFPNLPSAISQKLLTDIKSATETSPQAGSLREFAQTGARDTAELVAKPLIEAGKRLVEVQNRAITEYEQAVGRWISLQQEANNTFDSTVARDIANQNQITGLDRSLTFEELTKGFTTQQNIDAQRSGAAGSDLPSILSRLSQIDTQRAVLEDRAAVFQEQGGDPNADRANADALARLRLQQVSAETVLKQIATNTQITAAATQKLQEIENAKKSAQQAAEDFVTADPLERFRQLRQIGLAQAARSGAQFSGESARDALSGFRRLGAIEGNDAQFVDREIRQSLSNNPLAQQLFQRGGRTAQEALVVSPEEIRLRETLNQNRDIQRQGGQALGQRAQGRADEFLENANQRFDSIIGSLSNTLESFGEKIASIPPEIQFAGSVAVNVNITGDEALRSLRPNIEAIVRREIDTALRQNIDATQAIENRQNA